MKLKLNSKKSAKTIFALSEFVIATDELYECDDLTTEQYATLHAIFSDDEVIERLFGAVLYLKYLMSYVPMVHRYSSSVPHLSKNLFFAFCLTFTAQRALRCGCYTCIFICVGCLDPT